MADKKLLDSTNAELKQMAEEGKRHKENPRLIRLIELMATLTNTGSQEPEAAAAEEPQAAEPEPHQHAYNAFGRCPCGDCQHPKVVGGVCLTCDQNVA